MQLLYRYTSIDLHSDAMRIAVPVGHEDAAVSTQPWARMYNWRPSPEAFQNAAFLLLKLRLIINGFSVQTNRFLTSLVGILSAFQKKEDIGSGYDVEKQGYEIIVYVRYLPERPPLTTHP